METEDVKVVPFGAQFMQMMPSLDQTALSMTRTHTHTGMGDSGQDSETDSD